MRRKSAEPTEQPSSPGRVVFDSRGNPIWEWNTAAGDSTSILLKQLENDELALEPTRRFQSIGERARRAPKPQKPVEKGESIELEPEVSGKGFDPYNRS